MKLEIPRHNMHCQKPKTGKCTCYDTFDQFLQAEFIGGDGSMYAKDSVESAYENWVCELGAGELIEYGDAYGDYLRDLIENGKIYE